MNGVEVGRHRGGFTPFSCDLSGVAEPRRRHHYCACAPAMMVRSRSRAVNKRVTMGRRAPSTCVPPASGRLSGWNQRQRFPCGARASRRIWPTSAFAWNSRSAATRQGLRAARDLERRRRRGRPAPSAPRKSICRPSSICRFLMIGSSSGQWASRIYMISRSR